VRRGAAVRVVPPVRALPQDVGAGVGDEWRARCAMNCSYPRLPLTRPNCARSVSLYVCGGE